MSFGGATLPGTTGRVESDSHADMCCAGRNCVDLSFTNHVIDVYAFCQELGPMKLVPIALAATLATDKNGVEVRLIIILFGQQMDHTLLSSNQVCANDVELWNNPCDPYHDSSVFNPASNHPVLLEMDGIVAFAETRAPITKEIRELPHVELTSDVPWKPQFAAYNVVPYGEECVGVRRSAAAAFVR